VCFSEKENGEQVKMKGCKNKEEQEKEQQKHADANFHSSIPCILLLFIIFSQL
jgi:hypothetical protein